LVLVQSYKVDTYFAPTGGGESALSAQAEQRGRNEQLIVEEN